MKGQKKGRVPTIIAIVSMVGFIAFTLALLYPVISDRWNRYRDSMLIDQYNHQMSVVQESHVSELWSAAEEYNKKIGHPGEAVVTLKEYDDSIEYEKLLDISGNGMMGYIEIPSIDITEPIYHYSTDDSLSKGIGHIHGSSLPVGGETTHTILTGHRGLPNQKFFSDLDKLEVGHKFYLHILGRTLAYEIDYSDEVYPSEVGSLLFDEGEDKVTLITCTPYGVNTRRIVLTGARIPFDESNVDAKGLVTSEKHVIQFDPATIVFFGFLAFLILVMVIVLIGKIRKRRKSKTEDSAPDDGEEEPENKSDRS